MRVNSNTRNIVVSAAAAIIGTYGFCYIMTLAGVRHMSFSVLSLPVAAVLYILWTKVLTDFAENRDSREGKRSLCFSGCVSFLFSISMVAGYQLQSQGFTDYGVRGKGGILLRSLCFAAACMPFVLKLFKLADSAKQICLFDETVRQRKLSLRVFLVTAGIVFLCLVPVWLAYYPLIMSYDFHRQVNEAERGFQWFVPYQPLAHTWVIWLFYQLGGMLGSRETGMACMALFQMLLYALATGYLGAFLYRIWQKKLLLAGVIVYFGVFPFHSVMVLCSTKDVIFSILFLVFFLLLIQRSIFTPERNKWLLDLFLILEGCVMVQFRSNAIHALVVFFVLYFLIVKRSEKLRILILCILLTVGGLGTKMLVKSALGTTIPEEKIEMYSVPIQQFARVGHYHMDQLDPVTEAVVDHYIPCEEWPYYNPPLADTMKNSANKESFTGNIGAFVKDWIAVGIKYPNEYIDAFLELTRGYWFLDDYSWAENLGYGSESRFGTIFTYYSAKSVTTGEDILHVSRFPWLEQQLEKIVSGNCYYNWVLLSQIFKSAFFSWAMFLCMVLFWYRRQWKQLQVTMFPFLYFCTMLLGPVVQLRYQFPVMLCLPLMMAMLFWRMGNDKNE